MTPRTEVNIDRALAATTDDRLRGENVTTTQHTEGPRYFADRFDADNAFYVFDADDNGSECEGPFSTITDAERVAANLNEGLFDSGHSDPRPDPRTHPDYWTE